MLYSCAVQDYVDKFAQGHNQENINEMRRLVLLFLTAFAQPRQKCTHACSFSLTAHLLSPPPPLHTHATHSIRHTTRTAQDPRRKGVQAV